MTTTTPTTPDTTGTTAPPALLRVAVPNKGSLSETAGQMLAEAGYTGRRDPKELHVVDERNGVEFFYLRPRDIATYVGSGALDVGVTGRDLLIDSGSEAREIASLGFADSTFRFAGPVGRYTELQQIDGLRVATSYPGLVGRFLREHGVEVTLIRLDGAVESAIQLGVADVIADVVETGTTLRKAGLEIFGPVILKSTAVLVSGAGEPEGIPVLLRRLQGVLVAREYVLLDYDCPVALLETATALAPGFESPTVSPLHDPEWVAVRVMVPRADMNQVMDRLYDLGARAILVTSIHAARL
ncbi:MULTISPECIES: ATP phosphoribosyltransferase [unclassified Rathayibacter]|uniref:ATP phosphoribosyltransferase n=1 Tax=unclassified Rathayibacter TaxID=2609250 RepID=UPI000F4B30AC|nr:MULTISPECIES: ATP phosphoribosyltransferase [unclassified Rathayibacter]ROP50352.1 ATP phosphoribosyltransferase [Rathayibacter sp. PhB186]ROS53311.1 ATP phosphoribosyltransferase [Rathayibacter sp. PhB185]